MRVKRKIVVLALAAGSAAAPARAVGEPVDGTVKLGGIIVDEDGDKSAVQETYNIYDGFNLALIRLEGGLGSGNRFNLDLRDLNLDSRKGDLLFRVPGALKLTADFDQHRQVFDPDRAVTSSRKDWGLGARYTPAPSWGIQASVNVLDRGGDRLSFPAGTASVLGTRYDNTLVTGRLGADFRKGGKGAALEYRLSDYSDRLNPAADRMGHVLSARLSGSTTVLTEVLHLLRGAYGIRELSNSSLDYTLANFQYTGIVDPSRALRFKYNFDASRIDNESTRLKTDRFQNNFDAVYSYRHGSVSGGYGYETNDDDRTLTSYHSWNAGTLFRWGKLLDARVEYASRTKKDQEELTLLKDLEVSRIRARLEVRPASGVDLGAGYMNREREFPDIAVESEGDVVNGFARYTWAGWGTVFADYSYSKDAFTDLVAGFESESHIVTGRVEIDRIRDVRLAGGVTYLDIGRDLDIEKSMMFLEGEYTFRRNYHLEVKYNVYNYDDYILLDRYYTANIVWINVGYDLHFE